MDLLDATKKLFALCVLLLHSNVDFIQYMQKNEIFAAKIICFDERAGRFCNLACYKEREGSTFCKI